MKDSLPTISQQMAKVLDKAQSALPPEERVLLEVNICFVLNQNRDLGVPGFFDCM